MYKCVHAYIGSVQFSSVTQSCLTLHNPMDHSMLGLPVHHQLLESTQTHIHWVSDAIQPFHPLSSPSPPAFNLSQHQGLFQWVPLHITWPKYWFQLQHQSFQWIFKTDFLDLQKSNLKFLKPLFKIKLFKDIIFNHMLQGDQTSQS